MWKVFRSLELGRWLYIKADKKLDGMAVILMSTMTLKIEILK